MPELYLDLTELLISPIRTGIQRVEGELLRCWPDEIRFRIVRFDPVWGMVVLPEGAAGCLRHLFAASESEREHLTAELRRLTSSTAATGILDLKDEGTRLVVPEVFYEPGRVDYYNRLGPQEMRRVYFLIFDLLPLTHPIYYGPDPPPVLISAYYRLLRRASQVGFISRATQTAYFSRLCRTSVDGPTFYLGSDGLGPRTSSRPPGPNPVFSVIGTIEPRKNHALILEAFRAFQRERPEAQLRFYGRLGWHVAELIKTIMLENGKRGFCFVENPSDQTIRDGVIESTATIFASAAEGFGLPPVESLWLGTPAVVTRHIPSVENLGGRGLGCLDSIDKGALMAAMRTVSRDTINEELREQARRLELPTWKSFADDFSRWVSAVQR